MVNEAPSRLYQTLGLGPGGTEKDEESEAGVVPAAVLSGVYKVHNLEDAQARGLSISWAQDMEAMIEWIQSTGSPVG